VLVLVSERDHPLDRRRRSFADSAKEGQMNSRDPGADTVRGDLRTVYASLQKASLPTWLRLDLTMAQFKAMVAVEGSGGIGVCGLARELGMGDSAASLLVDQLVRRGYVGRKTDQIDRRRVHLTATSRGVKLLGELREGHGQSLERWLGELDDDQFEALTRGLRALAEAATATEVSAAPAPITETLRT
jgi:DNA-binding MarR family transcriptional regulator